MTNRFALIIILILQAGLGGCALGPERMSQWTSQPPTQVENLLAYYHRLSVASVDVQRKEHLEAVAANDRAPDDMTRMRLALTLMLPGASWRDDARLAQLLGAVNSAAGDQPSPRHDLATLMERMLQLRREDQRRCDHKMEAMREDRRRLEQRLEGAREECKKAEVLQQKLDELRDIDRDMRSKRPSRRVKP